MDNKKIVLSGIRPTGQLHLGNYLGALSNFVKMQNEGKYDSYYFIADLHALTTNPDPKELHTNVRHILAEYLAAGLDPEKSTIFVQSDIPEVSEMYLLLNMHVGIGELMRTAAFKDKARKVLGITAPNQGDDDEDVAKEIIGASTNKRVNAGLLTYPTLMAVDILIQRADFVPVGKDQGPGAAPGADAPFRPPLQLVLQDRVLQRAAELQLRQCARQGAWPGRQRQDGQERGQLHLSGG